MIFKDYELRLQAGTDDTYEIVKWGTAAAFAPITGGISFVIAGAAP